MLTALRFVHFSSELLLKEQMIIPAKKTLNDAFHINTKLINVSEISQKISREISCFLLIVSWRSFPLKSANFSANLPLKIPRNFAFFSAKYQKPCIYTLYRSNDNNLKYIHEPTHVGKEDKLCRLCPHDVMV